MSSNPLLLENIENITTIDIKEESQEENENLILSKCAH